jgi:integrase
VLLKPKDCLSREVDIGNDLGHYIRSCCRCAGRSLRRGAEKAITPAVGMLLIAERVALLSGRDDEFVAVMTAGFTGIRWGELVGLETRYVRSSGIRVEWQLYELDNGQLHRCPPKDESRRTIIVPPWLVGLLGDHIARTRPGPCTCHDFTYVFSGHRTINVAAQKPGPTVTDVARRAGVSITTVSAVLNDRAGVADETRDRVHAAVADLGYVRGTAAGVLAPHRRRGGFATWLFHPAANGHYPAKAPQARRPVPLLAEPWPGIPLRGGHAADRADACWLPISSGLSPHGLRHSYKTLMVELGAPAAFMDAQMGHLDTSVQGRYTHITPAMADELSQGLTERWHAALDARRALHPGSPVAVLDRLLVERGR